MSIRLSLAALLVVIVAAGCAASEGGSTPELASAGAGSAPDTAAAPTLDSTQPSSGPDSLIALADRSRILGDSTAPVWVVIVSDFQCPYCKVWHDQTFPALKREFVDNGQVRVAYLNLPLPQHQHAQTTAEMALCAGVQGRFWEFHDAVFDTQERWSGLPAGTTYFDSLLTVAKVAPGPFGSCMQSRAMQSLVQADRQRAVEARVRSTPTFFIGNGMRLEGAAPIEAFRDSIAKARRAPGAESR
jgi:protein-disulfide isomerase